MVVLLLLTLGLTGALAYQAMDAARSHQAIAESVLRDYAAYAAEQYTARAEKELEYYGFYPALLQLCESGAGELSRPLPDPAMVRSHAKKEDIRRALELVRYVFRFDLETGALQVSGRAPPAAVQGWLRDTLATEARTSAPEGWDWVRVLAGVPDGWPRMIVYMPGPCRSREPTAIFGFEADIATVRQLLAAAAQRGPLLPATLTRGVSYDSAVCVRVSDAAGHDYYASFPQYPAEFVGRDRFQPRLAGLDVEVVLHPKIAQALIIGGLPKSRLPLIAGLLALTAALVVAALLLLRREHELGRLRTEFVSNVSHELRTPLAQIRMFAETLKLGRVRSDTERERSVKIIDQEARRLTHLVENVLQFSRAEREVDRLSPEPTEMAPLVREVIEQFQPLAAARGAKVDLELEEGLEAVVDRGAVQQILLNLLDNAVKYGPAGQTLRIGMLWDNGSVRLHVDDEGPGIPKEDRERIWQRFSRLERERENAVAGTGIGLSVVRDLAEQHEGRAWYEEAPGGGSRFVIQLPNACRSNGVGPVRGADATPLATAWRESDA